MKRVKMLTNIAGDPSYHTGDIVELRDEIAEAWTKEGYCKLDRSEAPVENAKK